jgi:hypothetical protein
MAKAKKAKAKSGGDPLAPVKRNAFWIVLGLMLITALVCYFMGAGHVSGMREENLKKVTALSSRVTAAVPPEAVAEAGRKKFVEEHLKPTRNQVEQTWQSLYDAQLTVFDWPPQQLGDSGEVIQRGLPGNFIDAVKKMPPIEQLTPKHTLDASLSNTYRNFARNLVTDLTKILKSPDFIGSTTIVPGQVNTKTAPAAKPGEKQEEALGQGDLVLWTKRSQESTREDHFNFKESEPPLSSILQAQEDFWVYETLFRAIAATNEPEELVGKQPPADAKAAPKAAPKAAAEKTAPKSSPKTEPKAADKPADAKAAAKAPTKRLEPVIKKVLDVRIGHKYEAPKPTIEIKKEKSDDAGGQQEEGGGEKLQYVWQQDAQLRYVNENDEPLKVTEVKALVEGKQEYKRMPVYLKLELDQRSVGDFFVACMQSPVKIEWRQLTLTADPQYQRSKPSAAADAGSAQQAPASTEKKSFYDATIELYGVVYILYPPKLPALQAAEAPADGSTEEQPADATKAGEAAKTDEQTSKATP